MEAFLLGAPMEAACLGGEGDEYLDGVREAGPISLADQAARPILLVPGDLDRLTGLADAEALHARGICRAPDHGHG